jgi:transcriptional regulator with XRE-family HTH domain
MNDAKMMQKIGILLREIRYKRDEKMQTVANDTGISQSTISQIENGKYSKLNIQMLSKLADYYGYPVAHFFL